MVVRLLFILCVCVVYVHCFAYDVHLDLGGLLFYGLMCPFVTLRFVIMVNTFEFISSLLLCVSS